MNDKSIKAVIKQLNQGDNKGIYLQKLSDTVEYGIVWHKVNIGYSLSGRLFREKRELFYFIKNESAFYVGAVLIMESLDDLHAYVLKEHRRKGILYNAMSKVILPHILQTKEKIRITIDEDRLGEKKYEKSKRSASGLGFKSSDDFEFFLSKSDVQLINDVNVEMYTMTLDRIKELKVEMEDLANAIAKIDDEFTMALGSIPKLGELKQTLQDFSSEKLEDEYFKLKSRS